MARGILLSIDEDEACLRVRELVLRSAGYEVFSTSSASLGLTIFARTHVDLVILDYSMPGLDGGQIAERMRQVRPEVPILMLAGEYLKDGSVLDRVDCCMWKTDDPALLLARIDLLVSQRSRPRESRAGVA